MMPGDMNAARARFAVQAIARAIVGTIHEAGPMGAPAGHLYAALMHAGCKLPQFEAIMGGLVAAGLVVKKGDCYFAGVQS